MDANFLQSQIAAAQHAIEGLQRRLAGKAKDEASASSKIARIQGEVGRARSASTLQGKLRQIERLHDDVARIQKAKADLTKKITDQTAKLHKLQSQLYKRQGEDQDRQLKALQRAREADAERQRAMLAKALEQAPARPAAAEDEPVTYDAFISHASEDKEGVARPLAEALIGRGYAIWYDELQLKVGDSLRRSIDRGLARSRFGIVVLSPSFFAKQWPQYELDGLVAREMTGGKVVLPLWHKVTKDEVLGYSPSLADKVALNTATRTIGEIAEQLGEVLGER